MQKTVIIIASVVTAIGVALLISSLDQMRTHPAIPAEPPAYDYEVRKITIDDVMLNVEIADDSEKIQRGLMFRENLPEDQGMLFIFDREGTYSFWMMNMKIHLDMIWLDSDGKVVHIVEDAAPCIDAAHTSLCTFNPDEPAKYVLEVNSGFVQQHGINEDSVMRILT